MPQFRNVTHLTVLPDVARYRVDVDCPHDPTRRVREHIITVTRHYNDQGFTKGYSASSDLFGATLPRSDFGKGADAPIVKFMRKVDAVMVRDRCERHVAMQKARQENEAEFEMFQLV
jgi:hypothetical protein